MSLSNARTVFGVHTVTAFRRNDGTPYGMARVLQGSTFKLEGDTIELTGGSNKFSWAVEDGDISAELAFTVSEYPSWLFEVFGGKAPTEGTAEASGNVSTPVNKKGSSVVGAAGITGTITASTPADLKTGKYVLKAADTNTLDVYCLSNVDFGRGTLGDYLSDDLKIGSVDISSGATQALAGFGITFTGGASTTAFVAGDTATFEVRAVNTVNRVVKLGGIADVFPEFSAVVYAQKNANGAVFEIEIYRAKAIGVGLGAERKQFGQNEYTAKASYDATQDAVCRIREVE